MYVHVFIYAFINALRSQGVPGAAGFQKENGSTERPAPHVCIRSRIIKRGRLHVSAQITLNNTIY